MAFIAGIVGGLVQLTVPLPVRLLLLSCIGLGIVAREFGLVSFPIPENRRAVPEYVQTRGADVGAIQFGFEMGTGMRTYSPSGLPHLLLIAALALLPFVGALSAAVGFAAGRWIMARASNAYSDGDGWSTIWAEHKHRLSAAMAAAAVASLATGLISSHTDSLLG